MSDELRAKLEEAFDQYDDPAEEVVEETTSEPIEEEEEAPEEIQATEEQTSDEPTELEEEDKPVEATKAPAGWTPTQKEKWKDVPADIQKTILDRDKEVDRVLHESAEDRKVAHSYQQMVSQYAPVFAAEGVNDPMQGLQGLINITAQLQMGSPQQKAERIAGLISHYGVDIQALDSMLAGEAPADPQMAQIQQMLDQRLAPVDQLMQTVQTTQQQSQQRNYDEAGQSIEAFAADPKNEFFENVRNTMADFMDMAESRGESMSLQQAYDRACASDPEIAQVQASRRAQESQQSNAQSIQRKQNAASSISGRQDGQVQGAGDMSLRDTLEAAFDKTGI